MISVFGSLVGDKEIANVIACMKSQWMGFGKAVDEFEKKYQEKYQIPAFAMVDSGSNALFMAVKLLNLPGYLVRRQCYLPVISPSFVM